MTTPLFLDVIAGPMIAMYIGVKFILPLLLVGLVILITVKLIKRLKQTHKEYEP